MNKSWREKLEESSGENYPEGSPGGPTQRPAAVAPRGLTHEPFDNPPRVFQATLFSVNLKKSLSEANHFTRNTIYQMMYKIHLQEKDRTKYIQKVLGLVGIWELYFKGTCVSRS